MSGDEEPIPGGDSPGNPGGVHPPVLTKEVLDYLKAERGGHLWVDATLGTAGHSVALCEAIEGDGFLLGIERDPEMAAIAKRRLEAARQTWSRWRYRVEIGSYRDLPIYLDRLGRGRPRGTVADFGASFLQFTGSRGIGFQDESAPLDGRFNPAEGGPSIADLVNTWPAEAIADVLWRYGDERRSRTIARRIIERRRAKPFETVGDLAEVIRSCFPKRHAAKGFDPITRSWMALRIRVNDELEHVETGLRSMIESLAPGGGRLVTLSFHSGEARIIKTLFAEVAGPVTDPTNPFTLHPDTQRGYRIVTRKPVEPSEEEKERNPGSRSARLRCLERI